MQTLQKLLRVVVYTTAALLVGATTAFAASTISTNIQTDGTLSVTGLSTLVGGYVSQASSTVVGNFTISGGSLTLGSALTTGNGGTGLSSVADGALVFGGVGGGTANLTALGTSTGGSVLQLSFTTGRPTWVATSTLGLGGGGVSLSVANTWTALQQFNAAASTTLLSVYGPAYFGSTATSSFATNGALTVLNGLTLSSGSLTLPAAGVFDTASGALNIGATNATTITLGRSAQSVVFPGTASTSKLYVGADQNTTINGIIAGQCSIAATALTASTTTYVNCTGATGITTSYNVVVTPVSLAAPVVIQSASSTAANTIQIGLLDTGLSTTTAGGIPATTVNYWAFR